MIKKIVSVLMFAGTVFVVQANAQGFGNNYYMMGTVSVPTAQQSAVVNVPASTSTTPVVVPSTNNNVNTTCAAYLTTFHKFGDRGADVVKLQKFLNHYNGAKLNEKGYFGALTMQEVKNFQYAYGVKTTGAQYQKTTDVINKINCGTLTPKKDRIVVGGSIATISTPRVMPPVKIYPNASTLKPTSPTQNSNKPVVDNTKTKDTKISTTTDSAGFMSNFKDDYERVKENYKAYVLVFVLVLALFWFLRKAATE